MSAPLSIQEEGETVPIKELQEKNRDLEQKVQEKTKELKQFNEDLTYFDIHWLVSYIYSPIQFVGTSFGLFWEYHKLTEF